jgi:hypothetical protein
MFLFMFLPLFVPVFPGDVVPESVPGLRKYRKSGPFVAPQQRLEIEPRNAKTAPRRSFGARRRREAASTQRRPRKRFAH